MLDEIDHRRVFFDVETTEHFLLQCSSLSKKSGTRFFLSISTPHLKVKDHEYV